MFRSIRPRKRLAVVGGLTTLMVLALPGVAFAQEAEITAKEVQVLVDTAWTLVAAFLVFFMQAGFALVETGFTRQKNAANVIMKNLMDFSISSLAFWAIGFALMFGVGNAFVGTAGWFLSGGEETFASLSWATPPLSAKWIFQLVFAGTAATIVSGAMAERTKFKSYLLYSALISGIVYPISGHWIWGGGWLAEKGFLDFAGSTVVHSVGGWAALAGVLFIGPRIGKYGKDGKPRMIPGHSIPLAALGTFILWFGWFGFNPGSTMAMNELAAHVAVTTTIAGALGALVAMFAMWKLVGKPDVGMTMNGALAGLVAVTAPCAFIEPWAAAIIGGVGGLLVVVSVITLERKGIDDPVGAISVHGVCGVWGTLSVGIFAAPRLVEGLIDSPGLAYGGGFSQLGTQALGAVSVFAWAFGASALIFGAIKATVGLRVSAEEEIEGLDITEHGMYAYPEAFFGPATAVTPEGIESVRAGMRETHEHKAPELI